MAIRRDQITLHGIPMHSTQLSPASRLRSTLRAPLARRLGLPVCVTVLLAAGCADEPATTTALDDPQVVRFDAASPGYLFEGDGGSLLLGGGWEVPEGEGGTEPWEGYAWAQKGPSQVFFRRPSGDRVAFYAHCHPLGFEGAPVQAIRLRLNGRDAGEVELVAGWQEVHHVLPADALEDGMNELELEFAYARRPAEVHGTADNRLISVAFTELAVVPAEVPNPHGFLRATKLADGLLTMVPGAVVELPLPARHDGLLHLPVMNGDCTACWLGISQVAPGGAESALWQGPVSSASQREVKLSTPDGGLGVLRVALTAPPDGGGEVQFHLSPDLVSLRRRAAAEGARGAAGQRRAPHVFIYLVDTLRADVLEPYGAPPGRSPRIAELARDAVVYSAARSPTSWTLPAVVSLLTGEYARGHGVMNGKQRLAEDQPTLQQRLGELGYRTLGVSQSYIAGPAFGIERGFDAFYLNNQLSGANLRSQRVRRYLTEWFLAAGAAKPFFAYLHTVDPHAPYRPPEGYRELAEASPGRLEPQHYAPIVFMTQKVGKDAAEVAHLKALYAGEVAYADEQVGELVKLLRYLDLYDDSLIILVSDHGEEFGEHGGFDHGRTLYDELLRVPLIVKYPGGRWAGSRIDTPVSLIDVFPTVLAEAGEELAPGARPLQPDRLVQAAERSVFAEVAPSASAHLPAVDLRAAIRGRGKCIESLNGFDQFEQPLPRWQVFDLQHDPGEAASLAAGSELGRRCQTMMRRWEERVDRRGEEGNPAASGETLDQLRALGYIR